MTTGSRTRTWGSGCGRAGEAAGRGGALRGRKTGRSRAGIVIDVRAAAGAVTAWRILRRQPCYREAWQATAGETAAFGGGTIPIRRQCEADLGAAPWGLLAWEDPTAEDGPASPFWTDAPMAEGLRGRAGTPPFASLVRRQGGTVSGLLLLDGPLVLKVERLGAAGQVRIADGAAFDPAGGLGLYVPWGEDHMSRELVRAGDLREVLAGEDRERDPSPADTRASSCSPSTEACRKSPNG